MRSSAPKPRWCAPPCPCAAGLAGFRAVNPSAPAGRAWGLLACTPHIAVPAATRMLAARLQALWMPLPPATNCSTSLLPWAMPAMQIQLNSLEYQSSLGAGSRFDHDSEGGAAPVSFPWQSLCTAVLRPSLAAVVSCTGWAGVCAAGSHRTLRPPARCLRACNSQHGWCAMSTSHGCEVNVQSKPSSSAPPPNKHLPPFNNWPPPTASLSNNRLLQHLHRLPTNLVPRRSGRLSSQERSGVSTGPTCAPSASSGRAHLARSAARRCRAQTGCLFPPGCVGLFAESRSPKFTWGSFGAGLAGPATHGRRVSANQPAASQTTLCRSGWGGGRRRTWPSSSWDRCRPWEWTPGRCSTTRAAVSGCCSVARD